MLLKKSVLLFSLLLFVISIYSSSENPPLSPIREFSPLIPTVKERDELVKTFLLNSKKSASSHLIDNIVGLTEGHTIAQVTGLVVGIISDAEKDELEQTICLKKLKNAINRIDTGQIKEQKLARIRGLLCKSKPLPFDCEWSLKGNVKKKHGFETVFPTDKERLKIIKEVLLANKKSASEFEIQMIVEETSGHDIDSCRDWVTARVKAAKSSSLDQNRFFNCPTANERHGVVKEILLAAKKSAPESLVQDIVELTEYYDMHTITKLVNKMVKKSKTDSLDRNNCLEIVRKSVESIDEDRLKKFKLVQLEEMAVQKSLPKPKVVISTQEKERWLKAKEETLEEFLKKYEIKNKKEAIPLIEAFRKDLIQISIDEAFDLKIFKKMKLEILEAEKQKKLAVQLLSESEQMSIMIRKAKQKTDKILQEYVVELESRIIVHFSQPEKSSLVIPALATGACLINPWLVPLILIPQGLRKRKNSITMDLKQFQERKKAIIAEVVATKRKNQAKVWIKYSTELRSLIIKKMLSREKQEVLKEILQRYELQDEQERATTKEVWQRILDEIQKITIEIVKAEKQREITGKSLSKKEQKENEKKVNLTVAEIFEKYSTEIQSLPRTKYPLVQDIYFPDKESIYEAVEKVRHGMLEPGLQRGMIFYGPPGVGKTSMGEAMANEANCHIIKVGGAQGVLNMYVGGSQQAIKSIFAEARKKAAETGKGVFILIDELQELAPGTTDESVGLADKYAGQASRNTLAQIWTEYDTCLQQNDNVFLILSCNDYECIDKRLCQRLDGIKFSPPDLNGSIEILHHKAQHHRIFLSESELEKYAKKLRHLSGRELDMFFQKANVFISRGKSKEEGLELSAAILSTSWWKRIWNFGKKEAPKAGNFAKDVGKTVATGYALGVGANLARNKDSNSGSEKTESSNS